MGFGVVGLELGGDGLDVPHLVRQALHVLFPLIPFPCRVGSSREHIETVSNRLVGGAVEESRRVALGSERAVLVVGPEEKVATTEARATVHARYAPKRILKADLAPADRSPESLPSSRGAVCLSPSCLETLRTPMPS